MKQKIHNELNEALKYNLSFAGCGFLGIYHGEILRPAITRPESSNRFFFLAQF